MTINLEELARSAFAVAKGMIEEKQVEAMPTFLAELPNRELAIILAPWDSDAAKIEAFHAIRRMFAERGVLSYAFVSECWVSKGEGEWDGTAPRDDPNRLDVLMVDAHTRDGESYSLMVEIDTLANGKRAITKEPELRVFEKAEGRAVNLLMPEGAQGARH